MRKTAHLLAVLTSALLAAGSRAPATEPGAPATDDKLLLIKLERDWAEAVVKHDTAFIERVEADGYVYTDSSGRVSHKADDLSNAKTADLKIDSYKLEDLRVQIHGDAAVVTGQTTLAGSDHGGSLNGTYRWTDVFVRDGKGAWQVVASQATAVNKPAEVVILPAEASSTPGSTEEAEN